MFSIHGWNFLVLMAKIFQQQVLVASCYEIKDLQHAERYLFL
jgi:hypothetical protein